MLEINKWILVNISADTNLIAYADDLAVRAKSSEESSREGSE